jgi:alkylhydroperoxidase family enzyme
MPDEVVAATMWPVWCLPDSLRALAPEAVGLLDETNGWAWQVVPPALLEQLRLRIAALIGNQPGLHRRSRRAQQGGLTEAKAAQLGDYFASDAFSDLERDCLEFAEQFVIDVSGPMDEYVTRLGAYFPGEQLRGFVTALYVTEFTQRLEMTAGALLGSSADAKTAAGSDTIEAGSAEEALRGLAHSLRGYQSSVVRGTALDPVITELVRLRCARTHNCRICKTLRLADARAAGADDAMTAKVDFYEQSDLDDRAKVALRVTDAMISGPDRLDEALVAQARAAFPAAAIAELCLDITKWSTQKIHVSLGTDAADALPTNGAGVSFFDFDEDGQVAGFSATLSSS